MLCIITFSLLTFHTSYMGAGGTKPFNIGDISTGEKKNISISHTPGSDELVGKTVYVFPHGNYVFGNLRITDSNYIKVTVYIGITSTPAVLRDGVWTYSAHVPIFMMDIDECTVEIFAKTAITSVEISYDRFDVHGPDRRRAIRRSVTSSNLFYKEGTVC